MDKRKLFAIFTCCILIISCESPREGASSPGNYAQALNKKPEFNRSDKSITTNGNMNAAMSLIPEMTPDSVWSRAIAVSATQISKQPYSAIGNLVRFKGKIYKLEQLPPSELSSSTWTEMLCFVKNENSPFGTSTVDFIFEGDASNLNPNDAVIGAGYFCGTYLSPNLMGGEVECMTIIGNALKRYRPKIRTYEEE